MGTPGDAPPSVAIVEAVADAEGVDSADLEPALVEIIDPDALDRLFVDRLDGRPRAGGAVCFRYCGHDVVVDAEGGVLVDGEFTPSPPDGPPGSHDQADEGDAGRSDDRADGTSESDRGSGDEPTE